MGTRVVSPGGVRRILRSKAGSRICAAGRDNAAAAHATGYDHSHRFGPFRKSRWRQNKFSRGRAFVQACPGDAGSAARRDVHSCLRNSARQKSDQSHLVAASRCESINVPAKLTIRKPFSTFHFHCRDDSLLRL